MHSFNIIFVDRDAIFVLNYFIHLQTKHTQHVPFGRCGLGVRCTDIPPGVHIPFPYGLRFFRETWKVLEDSEHYEKPGFCLKFY